MNNKHLKNKIKHQKITDKSYGRSMVEMLGVLSIMGTLSIGGITSYTYAMEELKINEIKEGLRKRATVASQQRFMGQEINISEFGHYLEGYTITNTPDEYDDDPDLFAFKMQGVKKSICEKLFYKGTPLAVEIKVGGITSNDTNKDSACANETNDMIFAFENNLNEGATLLASAGDTAGNNSTPTSNNTPASNNNSPTAETPSIGEQSPSIDDPLFGGGGFVVPPLEEPQSYQNPW